MSIFEELDIQTLLKLYEKKKKLILDENLIELLQLKNTYPELFIKENEAELNNLVDSCNYIASMPHFKNMMKEERLNKFITIDFDEWKLENLENELEQLPVIYFKQILFISRKVARTILVTTVLLYHQKYETIELSDLFPYLGLLVIRIIQLCPAKRRAKMIESALFKLRYDKNEHPIPESDQWKKSVFFEEMHHDVENAYEEIITSVIKKFDNRAGFYDDLIFFWLIYTTEYIALLAPHIHSKHAIKTVVDLILKANINHVE